MNTLQIYGILNKNISENSSFDGKYNSLTEQPQINGITLTGNKTLEDLGIIKTIKDVVGDITGTSSDCAPVGTIISYMGNIPPKGYLACDGKTYSITQYPELVKHFEETFENINFFGGDGTTTFAVPDLKGEFLRGSGANGHLASGNGANVGEHQDATTFPDIYFEQGDNNLAIRNNISAIGESNISNRDTNILGTVGKLSYINIPNHATVPTDTSGAVTSRPTNTSVLYCIKYQTTLRKTNRKYIINTDSLKVIAGDEICEVILNEYQLSTDWTVMINIPEIFLPSNFARGSGYVVADGKTYLAMCLINPENKNQIIFRYMFNNEYRTGREGDKVGGNLLWAYGK